MKVQIMYVIVKKQHVPSFRNISKLIILNCKKYLRQSTTDEGIDITLNLIDLSFCKYNI